MIRNKNLMLIAGLIVIGFFIYAFNLNNPLFWDDDEWIKDNIFVHSFSYIKEIFTQNVLAGFGLQSNYYRPLLLLSFVFNYVLHGIAPFGYHLVSNGFHIANGALIFILLHNFIGARASFIASLLFLVHPAQTEAVTYISGRGDPLSVFFMLLSLFMLVKTKAFGAAKASHLTFYDISLKCSPVFLFILAILSRETAILFPLLLMIFYISFLTKEKFIPALKRSFIVSLPFWVISVFYFVLRLTVFNFENTLNFYAQSNVYTENLLYRLYTFGAVLVEYFKIIFWPVGLHMERDFPIFTSLFQWPVWLGALIIASVIIIGLIFYRFVSLVNSHIRIDTTAIPQRAASGSAEPSTSNIRINTNYTNFRIWFFGWFWFFIALGPVSGIIPINAFIYEHWLYLPLVGFSVLAGFYLDKILFFLKNNQKLIAYYLLLVILVVYFSFFAVQSIRRNILWGKPIEFYEDILRYDSGSVRILTNLGNLYSEKGDLANAESLFKQAIQNPAGNIFAQPHYNLGNLYRDTGRIDEAIGEYKKAIEIDSNFPFAYQNLAVSYINDKQNLVEGAKVLEQLKKVQPGNPRVYYNLGLVYLATNNFDLAVRNLELGLDLASGRDPEMEKAILEILSRIR